MSATADPRSAREHARAMGGTRVEAMPTLPASMAGNLPAGIDPQEMIWEETVAAGGYSSKRVARGARLRLTDIYGDACASLLLFNAETPSERLNVADTVKVQWNAYLEQGKLLLSDMGRVLATILEDDAGTHDVFCGASSQQSNARKYGGDGAGYGPHPNARDRFLKAVAKHGLTRRDVHPCINFFKGVTIGGDGSTRLAYGPFTAGRSLTLRAEMDLIVVLANCPHVLDPRADYTVTSLRIAAWRGEPATEDDAVRNSAPEALRAFLNTEDYYRR